MKPVSTTMTSAFMDPARQLYWIGWFPLVFGSLGLLDAIARCLEIITTPSSMGPADWLRALAKDPEWQLSGASLLGDATHSLSLAIIGGLCTRSPRTASRGAMIGGSIALLGSCAAPIVSPWLGQYGWLLFLIAPLGAIPSFVAVSYITALGMVLHFEQVPAVRSRWGGLLGRPLLLVGVLASVTSTVHAVGPSRTIERQVYEQQRVLRGLD